MPRTRGGILDPFDGLDSASGGRKASRGPRGRGHLEFDEATLDDSALDYSKGDFEINELVLAQNPERNDSWWPVKSPQPSRKRKLKVSLHGPEEWNRLVKCAVPYS